MSEQNKIPLLGAEDIECRVQSVSQTQNGKVGAVLLIYKDARVDMRILDQVYGPTNWQRTHEVIDGTLYCNIDIWDEDKKTWVRKQDAGVESNTEKEKGRASDAFKRSGFNVGIGRELYTAPFIWIELKEGEYYDANRNGGGKPLLRVSNRVRFSVSDIGYDDNRRINKIIIADQTGEVRYSLGVPRSGSSGQNRSKGTSNKTDPPKQSGQTAPEFFKCAKCGKPIKDTPIKGGRMMSAFEVADFSIKRFGVTLCPECQIEANRNNTQ